MCVQDTQGRHDKLAMQGRQRNGDVWLDRLFRRRPDCHRIDPVNDDADHVGILDLDGCQSGMYPEPVLPDRSMYTDTFILRKLEHEEMDSFQ